MSLKHLHILFIILSTALLFFFAYWAFQEFASQRFFGYLITSLLSVLSAVGLGIYGANFYVKSKVY